MSACTAGALPTATRAPRRSGDRSAVAAFRSRFPSARTSFLPSPSSQRAVCATLQGMSSNTNAPQTTFRTTIFSPGGTKVGIVVPPDAVAALGAGQRPPVTVTVGS